MLLFYLLYKQHSFLTNLNQDLLHNLLVVFQEFSKKYLKDFNGTTIFRIVIPALLVLSVILDLDSNDLECYHLVYLYNIAIN